MFEIVFDKTVVLDISATIIDFLKSMDAKPSSISTYKRQLKEFILWQTKYKITHPTREDILDYKEYLVDNKNLAALTVAGYLTAVRKLFAWLDNEKKYPHIAKGIKSPKRKKGFKKDALSPEQVNKLLDSIDQRTLAGKRDFAMLNLMVRTGLRTIEITRATREDITVQAGSHVLWIHGKGRDSKDELVLLTSSTLDPIQKYIQARGKVRNNDPLFVSHSPKNFGRRLTTRSVSRIVKDRLDAMGINDTRITAHSLRHTAITLSLLAGATPQETRAMARHADINTTMIYAHNIDRIAQAPEKKIDTLIGKRNK